MELYTHRAYRRVWRTQFLSVSIIIQFAPYIIMRKIALRFPSIVELVDFSLVMTVKIYEVDRSKLTIIAAFSLSDVELAMNNYKAVMISLPTKDKK